MKKITDKWKGLYVTFNVLGNIDNDFGLKKKKMKLKDLDSLFELNNFDRIKTEQKNNKTNGYNNFELINIKDYEKSKNINFLNYLKYNRFFGRINSSKRFLPLNRKLDININNKYSIVKSEFNRKKETKKIMNNKLESNKKKKEKEIKLSNINLDTIISKYIQENKKDIQSFNETNLKINNKMKINNRMKIKTNMKLNFHLFKNDYIKTLVQPKMKISNSFTNRNSNSMKKQKMNKSFNKFILDSKNNSEKKYNNKMTRSQKMEKFKSLIKKGNSSDASTNTDYYYLK